MRVRGVREGGEEGGVWLGAGLDGAFPEESLQSVSLRDIRQSTLSALKTLEWTQR